MEGPVEAVEGLDLGQLSLLQATLEEELTAALKLVLDEQFQELDEGEVVGDGLLVAHGERLDEAGQAQVT